VDSLGLWPIRTRGWNNVTPTSWAGVSSKVDDSPAGLNAPTESLLVAAVEFTQCGPVSGVAIAFPIPLASLVPCPSVPGLLVVMENLPLKPPYFPVFRPVSIVASAA
jgi:hypothetical protein